MLKQYSEYKDSGVEWLGKVPASWTNKRLKYLARLINDKGLPDGEGAPINLENIESWTGQLITAEASEKEAPEEEMKQFKAGDVLFNKLRPYLAKAYRAGANGVCGGELLVLRPWLENMMSGFLFYRLVSKDFIDVVDGATYGTKMPRASWDFIGGLRIPHPSTEEQEEISGFLDNKTARIDNLIAKKQRMIELLKEERAAVINQAVTKGLDPSVEMKDSGVDWLGEVPSRWKAGKIRFAFVTVSGNGFPDDLQGRSEGDMPFYKVSDINSSDLYIEAANNYVSFSDIQTNRWNVIPEGSIVLAKIGAALAKNHRKITNTDCLIDNNMMAVTPKDKGHCVKYYYYLMSVIKMEWFSNPGAVPSVDLQRFRSFFIPNVPPEEQKAIASFLDQKTAQIDGQISREERSIELLKEYRTALISEAVTGKIDVRN